MPELPEIESVCRVMEKTLKGHRISHVTAFPDEIVFKHVSHEDIEQQLHHKTVSAVGRKGKYFWLEFEGGSFLLGHLGMSGWVERIETEQETPRFSKLRLDTAKNGSIVITDMRRLGRIWMTDDPANDKTIKALGPDAYRELPTDEELHETLHGRKAPIKALLLDQKLFAGIGNYLADEVLYQARISPHRTGNTLTPTDASKLHDAIAEVIGLAVDAGADENKFPETWIFHHRWGGKKGAEIIGDHKIVRETVGGRTTAWVPELQK